MQHSEQINELAAALAKAQAEITGARRSSENPFFRSKYADLAEVWDVIRGPLSKNEIAVYQAPEMEDGRVKVTTMLIHASGQWARSELSLRMVKERRGQGGEREFVPLDDPQSAGSAITYARRYALAAAVGVAQEDDDGNAASVQPSRVSPRWPEGEHSPKVAPVPDGVAYTRQSEHQPKAAKADKSLLAELKALADKLGIPPQARKALLEDCKGDLAKAKEQLEAAIRAKGSDAQEHDTDSEPKELESHDHDQP
jgi:hypothetical protein